MLVVGCRVDTTSIILGWVVLLEINVKDCRVETTIFHISPQSVRLSRYSCDMIQPGNGAEPLYCVGDKWCLYNLYEWNVGWRGEMIYKSHRNLHVPQSFLHNC